MRKRTSISDLADSLSVSVSTVSRALHDHPSISEKMKKRVAEKAKELHYRPNNYAVNLKRGSCMTLAVIVPVVNRNFFSSAINGIEDVARSNGYDVIIYQSHNSHDSELRIVNSLSFGKVDGVIASVSKEKQSYEHYEKMVNYGMPLVFFDNIIPSENIGSVRIDDYRGSYIATEHFIKQGLKKIYHFAGDRNVLIWEDRARGYEDAMHDNGLHFDSSWIFQAIPTEANGQEYVKNLLANGDIPDAIVFAGDYAALGAIVELNKNGLRVPEDVAVTGFAAEPFCSMLSTPLTSVDQAGVNMGREAAQILIDKISDKPYRNVVIEPKLIIRKSSLKKENKDGKHF